MPETIVRIPVAGSSILDKPLFVYRRAIRNGEVIGDSHVTDELQVVDAICRIGGGSRNDDRGKRRSLNNSHVLSWVDNERWFDELGWSCWWDEGRFGGDGGA